MNCPKCQKENPAEAEYCWACYHDFIPNAPTPKKAVAKVPQRIDKYSPFALLCISATLLFGLLASIYGVSLLPHGQAPDPFSIPVLAAEYWASLREGNPIAWVFVLFLPNLPLFSIIGRCFFRDMEQLMGAFWYLLFPDKGSFLVGVFTSKDPLLGGISEYNRDKLETFRLLGFFLLCGLALFLECAFILFLFD